MLYYVRTEETTSKVYEVEASSEQEAKDKVFANDTIYEDIIVEFLDLDDADIITEEEYIKLVGDKRLPDSDAEDQLDTEAEAAAQLAMMDIADDLGYEIDMDVVSGPSLASLALPLRQLTDNREFKAEEPTDTLQACCTGTNCSCC